MIKRASSGSWKLDEYPFGSSGKRARGVFKTRREAQQFLNDFVLKYGNDSDKPYRLSDLVDLWFKYHGHSLRDSKTRLQRTSAIVTRLGNPFANQFTTEDFAAYRLARLRFVSRETVNHETRYLRAVFNELIRLGVYSGENPLSRIRVFSIQQRELSYLTHEQRDLLLSSCRQSRSLHLVAVVLLALNTGARWSEASCISHRNVLDDRVIFVGTKNGKNRTVPLDPVLSRYLHSVANPATSVRMFDDCLCSFKRAVKRSGLSFPRGQMTHMLRHTYASWFVMNGGTLEALQRVLGHSDMKVTQRYAHLSDSYLKQARELGPFKNEIGHVLGMMGV